MEQVATVAALAALASQLTTLVKFLTAREWTRAVTTVTPWVTAFGALVLGAQADATADIVLPGFIASLGDLDMASLVYAAVTIGAAGGLAHKALVSLDASQSAAEPALGGGPASGV